MVMVFPSFNGSKQLSFTVYVHALMTIGNVTLHHPSIHNVFASGLSQLPMILHFPHALD